MNKQEELLRRCEKLVKAAKKGGSVSEDKPCSCRRCQYYRPDFKYRKCQFSRCQFDQESNVFRKKPLRRDKFSRKEVVSMDV